MADLSFVYIWKYAIKPDLETEFLSAYASDGEWVKLFSKDPNYIKTELLHDTEHPSVYVTIDHWTSKAARDTFREKHLDAFEDLDKRCEAITVSETLIGDFVINDARAT